MKTKTKIPKEKPKTTPAPTQPERKPPERVLERQPVPIMRKACACGGTCPSCKNIQFKLNVSQPGDPLEIEADRVADQVMRMPLNKPIQQGGGDVLARMADNKKEEEGPQIQRMAKGSNTPAASQHHSQLGGGAPLSTGLRSFFEPRFKQDLSGVRIHNDPRAHQMAESLNARAYTLGNHIVFNNSEYSPHTLAGRTLLAHEITHTIQQGGQPRTVMRTVKSALQLIADYRKTINAVGTILEIDPMLIARVLFQENRNDGNLSRFNDYSWYNDWNFTGVGGPEVKNAGADYLNTVFEGEGSVGIGEMRVPTARMLLDKYFPDREWSFDEMVGKGTYTTDELENRHINGLLTYDDEFAIIMTGLYLFYLSESPLNQQGDDLSIGPSQETLLKDYNRGLSGHERGVESTVGRRSGPYILEIRDALENGTVPEKPTLKDDYRRFPIHVNNQRSQHIRIYVAFHSERNNESAWFNNDFSSYWEFAPGDGAHLRYQGEDVVSDQIRFRIQMKENPGDSWGPLSPEQAETPGYAVEGSKYILKLTD